MRIETHSYCSYCGQAITGRGHYDCSGYKHHLSISERLEAMRRAFEAGDRNAAQQQLRYLQAEAKTWIDELDEVTP